MKQAIYVISIFLLTAACQKQVSPREDLRLKGEGTSIAQNSSKGNLTITSKKSSSEIENLIQQFVIWGFSRPFAEWPNFDVDGSMHDAGQCSSCGVYMLTGGNPPNPYYTRYVTIDIAKYQYVFVPLVAMAGWFDPCDMVYAPKAGQSTEGFYKSWFAGALADKKDLSLTWDGKSILSKNPNDHRASSGVFLAKTHPDFYTNCTTATTTWYADGYWAKIPLTVGEHTLVFSGSLNWRKMDMAAYNEITYHITVIDSRLP